MQLPENTLEIIDKAMASLEARPDLANREEMRAMLCEARREAERALRTPLRTVDPAAGEADLALSLILSAADHVLPPPPEILVGTVTGEDLDPGWIGSLYNYIHTKRVPFPTHDEDAAPGAPGSGVLRVADSFTLTMVGDWGIHNASAASIAARMRALNPSYTVHLGDVYYSGTVAEEREKFTDVWPEGREGAFALNSNHEMYAGGEGYFNVALADPKFALQEGRSYFALENRGTIVFGLDSAYPSHAWLYDKGDLDPVQIRFVETHAARARAAGKRILVLTHHHPIDMEGAIVEPLCEKVTSAVGPGEITWYWGHIHGAAVFKPRSVGGVTIRGRCVGHGGIPYGPLDLGATMEWTEREKAGDPEERRRALNGFAFLRIDGAGLEETLYDEKGRVRHVVSPIARAA